MCCLHQPMDRSVETLLIVFCQIFFIRQILAGSAVCLIDHQIVTFAWMNMHTWSERWKIEHRWKVDFCLCKCLLSEAPYASCLAADTMENRSYHNFIGWVSPILIIQSCFFMSYHYCHIKTYHSIFQILWPCLLCPTSSDPTSKSINRKEISICTTQTLHLLTYRSIDLDVLNPVQCILVAMGVLAVEVILSHQSSLLCLRRVTQGS